MKRSIKFSLATVLIIVAAYTGVYYATLPSYQYKEHALPADFDSYYRMKLAETQAKGGRTGNEEKLVRFSPGKTKAAILYVHGFGASRAEGEASMDKIAAKLKANIYYLRLPGHGTNNEDHRDTDFREYLTTAEESLLMMDKLGDKIVLVGTSMGGLISTYLASKYPDKIHALILLSPFFDFTVPVAKLFYLPGGTSLAEMINGKIRKSPPRVEGDGIGEKYYEYWYKDQYLSSVQHVSNAKKFIASNGTFANIHSPTLLIYYYKDKDHQDKVASVPAMLEAFSKFGGEHPNPLNTKVAVEQGHHVLTSKHVSSDKEKIESSILDFLSKTGIQ
ncbi:alpha/beta hydrolase family protein [Leptospira inadai serovar Lyme str. 10]|uniref:Alpha/beta hydrolase family protein n=2 Tax=Leptospira inadai serovar Lyme TaxID=293084 RepID=V6HCM0_9LEPT|nr:alpha/beta fold hydrolase [Leptospira inadai]EQA37676.1 alpha/beta hydrolase family protein [Leptospira inadai serovar Lyme str. 10]PNV73280.1 hypothetical protein BES34_017435 [Leptospira inadai serovar Lyme]